MNLLRNLHQNQVKNNWKLARKLKAFYFANKLSALEEISASIKEDEHLLNILRNWTVENTFRIKFFVESN